ncbi:MAG TPA: DUF4126 domain-containing protein [Ignavibacteria bacterium]|nr:DUF4126 domain-containing protein [Ignavibacteria bacterium]HQY53371.1 DUF4126 domain-containing protein [Ignavibacteria bacterium]
MDIAFGILLGIGLSAAAGFRVFLPLLVTNIVSMLGYINLTGGFEWMGGWIAFTAFLVAAIVEISAYYIPWLDNLLDTISGPLAMVAGTVLTASFLTEANPLLQWVLGIIVGGGTAGIVKVGASAARLTSTATTGGAGNAVIATGENVMSVVVAILSFIIPFITAFLVFLIVIYLIRKFIAIKKSGFFEREEKISEITEN